MKYSRGFPVVGNETRAAFITSFIHDYILRPSKCNKTRKRNLKYEDRGKEEI